MCSAVNSSVLSTVCLVLLFFKLNLYFEFYYSRRWFYLLILITIIDLALLNLKQMLEVLTAQVLGLGVRSSVTMDEMKTTPCPEKKVPLYLCL